MHTTITNAIGHTCRCRLLSIAVGAALLQLGTCGTIAQNVAINGFFDGVNPILVERAADALDVNTGADARP